MQNDLLKYSYENLNNLNKGNYRLANMTLIAVVAGFFISYPFRSTIWGGLAFSAFSAGMVAGLADWFAVTALFRKPLGIPPGRIIRTEIIPRNRDRLFAALSDMVEKELLSKESLKQRLAQYDNAGFLLRYLSRSDVQCEISSFISSQIRDYFMNNPGININQIGKLLRQGLLLINQSPLISSTLENSLRLGYLEKFNIYLTKELRSISVMPEFKEVLSTWLQEAYQAYELDNPARKLVNSFLPSPQELASEIQDRMLQWLDNLDLSELVHTFSKNNWSVITGFITEIITELDFEHLLNTTDKWRNINYNDKLLAVISLTLKNSLISVQTHQEWHEKLDHLLKTSLVQFIDTHHAILGQMVQSSLESLSNNMLVDLIEQKAGNDLQMIRINGSVVGSLAGILFYLFNLLLQ